MNLPLHKVKTLEQQHNGEAYKNAVAANDAAFYRTCRELDARGELNEETMHSIMEESRMWLREIFENHHRIGTKVQS